MLASAVVSRRAVSIVIALGAAASVAAYTGVHWASPPQQSDATSIWRVRITDGEGGPLVAARLLLFGPDGEAVRIGKKDLYDGKRQAAGSCELGPGAVGTSDGIIVADGTAEIPVGTDNCNPAPAIPRQRYVVWAWQGIEFDRNEFEVDLSARHGVVESTIVLTRAFRPHGALAADLHVHAARSNDSGVPDEVRVKAQLAAGVQVIGLSDHNSNGDLATAIASLGEQARVVSIASNEVSVSKFHLGIYPVKIDAAAQRGGAPAAEELEKLTPAELFAWARGLPRRPVVQVNHPRFRYAALFDSFGWDGTRWPPPFPTDFDAVEVLSGHTAFNTKGDRRIDESVRDVYTFWNHGLFVAAMGNSDTHHLNGVLDALTRTYVFVDDPTISAFDEDAFVEAIRNQRAIATSGPWIDLEVASAKGMVPTAGPGQGVSARDGTVFVSLELAWANFVGVTEARIVVGGTVVHREPLDPAAGAHSLSLDVAVGRFDTWLAVEVSGESPLPVELTGTYQVEKGREGVTPFALTNPVFVDVDGDGVVTLGARTVTVSDGSRQ